MHQNPYIRYAIYNYDKQDDGARRDGGEWSEVEIHEYRQPQLADLARQDGK